jgi:hypothetical protein
MFIRTKNSIRAQRYAAAVAVTVLLTLWGPIVDAKARSRPVKEIVAKSRLVAVVTIDEAHLLSAGQICGFAYSASVQKIYQATEDTKHIEFSSRSGLQVGRRYLVFVPNAEEIRVRERALAVAGPYDAPPGAQECVKKFPDLPLLDIENPPDILAFDDNSFVATHQDWIRLPAAGSIALSSGVQVLRIGIALPPPIASQTQLSDHAFGYNVVQFNQLEREILCAIHPQRCVQ